MTNTQIVIHAGGRGIRLKHLTASTPKPMVEVNGKPFLDILLNMLKRRGFARYLISVGYFSDAIESYFGNGSKLNIKIEYSKEYQPLGTAGGLKNAKEFLKDKFVLINGDTFLDFDYCKFIDFALSSGKICTMTCYKGKLFNETKYNLKVDNDGIVSSYSKTNLEKNFNAVDAGIYFMKKEILAKIPNGVSFLETDVFPSLIIQKQISGFNIASRFYDIGTIQSLHVFEGYEKKHKMGYNGL